MRRDPRATENHRHLVYVQEIGQNLHDLLSNFKDLKCLKTNEVLFSIPTMCVVQFNPELVKKAVFGRSELEEIYPLGNVSSSSED